MKRFKNLKKTGDLNYIYIKELDKACFALDAAFSDSKDLGKRTILGNVLKDRVYEIAINLKYDGCIKED